MERLCSVLHGLLGGARVGNFVHSLDGLIDEVRVEQSHAFNFHCTFDLTSDGLAHSINNRVDGLRNGAHGHWSIKLELLSFFITETNNSVVGDQEFAFRVKELALAFEQELRLVKELLDVGLLEES